MYVQDREDMPIPSIAMGYGKLQISPFFLTIRYTQIGLDHLYEMFDDQVILSSIPIEIAKCEIPFHTSITRYDSIK